MMKNNTGWLVNDRLSCISGVITFWNHLLEWFPHLVDKTNGHTDYSILADTIESQLESARPHYIIRNGSYFRRIRTDVKTISLLQDVMHHDGNQIDVIRHSTIVVFNTNYVYQKYKHLLDESSVRICPLGVNVEFFRPLPERHPSVLPNSILFIGASNHYPKGFDVMLQIMIQMEHQNFCLIMKDSFSREQLPESIRHRVYVVNRVDQETVRLLINSCSAAVCTSREETQHLSGIECCACNLPVVGREVGFYYDCKDDKEWGLVATDDTFVEQLNYVMSHLSEFHPREYICKKYSTEQCKENWVAIIESL